jgi:HNH endonuclease
MRFIPEQTLPYLPALPVIVLALFAHKGLLRSIRAYRVRWRIWHLATTASSAAIAIFAGKPVYSVPGSLIVWRAATVHPAVYGPRRLAAAFTFGAGSYATWKGLTLLVASGHPVESGIYGAIAVVAVVASQRFGRLRQQDKQAAKIIDERPSFSLEERQEIIERDNRDGIGRCLYCGAVDGNPGVRLQCDHVIPRSEGGETKVHNGQMLCGPCNNAKRAKPDDVARREYRDRTGHQAGSWAA